MDTGQLLEYRAVRELLLFFALFFLGFTVLPVVVFLVGQAIFGSYGGEGFAGFFGELWNKLTTGEFYAWFLVLSPYLALQTLRLAIVGWRAAGGRDGDRKPARARSPEM